MPGEITFETYTAPTLTNRFTPAVLYLKEQHEKGNTDIVARIPAPADEAERKLFVKEIRAAANAHDLTATQQQPAEGDKSGDLLVGVRPKISHKPHTRKEKDTAEAPASA